jgi:hypothetical protein
MIDYLMIDYLMIDYLTINYPMIGYPTEILITLWCRAEGSFELRTFYALLWIRIRTHPHSFWSHWEYGSESRRLNK